MAFISGRNRLTILLASAARGKKGSGNGEGQMSLPDVNKGRLSRLKYKLLCHFELAMDMVEGGSTEFVNDTVGPAFLERKLMSEVLFYVNKILYRLTFIPCMHFLRIC